MKRILPLMQSPKFPGLTMLLAVLMMSINKCVNEAHHHDPILEASQEHLGDSLPSNRGKHFVQEKTLDIELDTFAPHLQCAIFLKKQ